jgi:hypothetical protein
MIRRYIDSCFIKTILLVTVVIVPASSVASAGTICGTVRDVDTLAPVNRAGIFVRTQDGTYTGHHGATDETGNFCIDGIAAGTYDLEIAVDDYETRYVRGVEVTDDVTHVNVDVFDTAHHLYAPWPNPARTSVTLRYRVGYPVPVRLQIYDVHGRLVRGWQDNSAEAGKYYFSWDLRGRDGALVPSGVYFARFSAGSINKIRKIVTLH